MANDTDMGGKSDHLKYYCIVFGVLVVVIGVVAFMQRKTLNAYKVANKQARSILTATGTTSDGRPRGLGELAVEVEKFVQGYRASSGHVGGPGISNDKMEQAERAVKVERTRAGPETNDPNQSKGYRTTYRDFTYATCSLDQLTTLMRNIESWGRYRVFEVRWQLADVKANLKPPHNLIKSPTIKVGFRTPITRER